MHFLQILKISISAQCEICGQFIIACTSGFVRGRSSLIAGRAHMASLVAAANSSATDSRHRAIPRHMVNMNVSMIVSFNSFQWLTYYMHEPFVYNVCSSAHGWERCSALTAESADLYNSLPSLYVLGPPHTGTTTLWHQLKQHPGIRTPSAGNGRQGQETDKEPAFWSFPQRWLRHHLDPLTHYQILCRCKPCSNNSVLLDSTTMAGDVDAVHRMVRQAAVASNSTPFAESYALGSWLQVTVYRNGPVLPNHLRFVLLVRSWAQHLDSVIKYHCAPSRQPWEFCPFIHQRLEKSTHRYRIAYMKSLGGYLEDGVIAAWVGSCLREYATCAESHDDSQRWPKCIIAISRNTSTCMLFQGSASPHVATPTTGVSPASLSRLRPTIVKIVTTPILVDQALCWLQHVRREQMLFVYSASISSGQAAGAIWAFAGLPPSAAAGRLSASSSSAHVHAHELPFTPALVNDSEVRRQYQWHACRLCQHLGVGCENETWRLERDAHLTLTCAGAPRETESASQTR